MADLVIEHVNLTVDVTERDKAKPIPLLRGGLKAKEINIKNTHASQILYVSFDKKKTFRQIPATAGEDELKLGPLGENDWIKIKKDHVYAYASGASTGMEIVMLIEQKYSSETE
jgi:hypothetical protein